jgi:hypothetical protein
VLASTQFINIGGIGGPKWCRGMTGLRIAPMGAVDAARARIGHLLVQERVVHPDATYLRPAAHHHIGERHREKVVKYINEVSSNHAHERGASSKEGSPLTGAPPAP